MMKRIWQLSGILALALLVSPCTAFAAEQKNDKADAKAQKARQDDNRSVVESEAELGIYYLDDDAYRFGKYSGLTDDGAYALLDFRWEKRPAWNSGDPIRWRLQGWRLGLDSRRLEFDWSHMGKQRLRFDYRQIPNNGFRDGMTPYQGLGSGVLTLPSNWAIANGSNNTRGFLNLGENLRPFEMRTERKSFTLSYALKVAPNWKMAIDFRHDDKDGKRDAWGVIGHGLTSARSVEIPAPVDWTTDNIELMFHYASGRLRLGGGVYASFFNNGTSSLTWQNAFGKVGNWAPGIAYPDGSGRMALEPDNSYLQFKGYGSLNLGSATRLTGDLAWGRMEQDDAFLPYTVNAALAAPVPLPRENANAQIDVTRLGLRLTSRLARRLSLVANYRYENRDNSTPRLAYDYIGGDSENQKPVLDSRINLPYSYKRQKADLLLNWKAMRGLSLKGGVEWNDHSRDYTEVEDSDEIAWLAGIRWTSMQTLSARLDYRYSDRNVDEYVHNAPFLDSHLPGAVAPDEWQNHPWQRKYNLTDRTRDELRGRLDWFPVSGISLGLTGSTWEDDYGEGIFGLNRAEATSWSFDAAYNPGSGLVLSGFYTRENWKTRQSNRQIFSFDPQTAWRDSRDWSADSEDTADTFNLHASFEGLGKNKALAFGFDYTISNVDSRIEVSGAERIDTLPLPVIRTDWSTVSAYGEYQLNKQSQLRLRAELNKLDASDFALDDVVPDTLANVLTLGQSTQEYDVVLISASWNYRF